MTRPPLAHLIFLIPGVLALAALTVWAALRPEELDPALVATFALVASIPLGAAVLCHTWCLTGGRWGRAVRLLAPPFLRLAWLLPILAIPLLFCLPAFPWAAPHPHEHADTLLHRRPWMAPPFVLARAAASLALWILIASLTARRRRDPNAPPPPAAAGPAAAGVIAILLTTSFLAIDWMLALQTPVHSSIFGLAVFAAAIPNALALLTLLLIRDARHARFRPNPPLLGDLGALLLSALVLDFYMSFAQFLIAWNGNLPGSNHWYEPRMHGQWTWLSLATIALRYVLPIPVLISHALKRNPRTLAAAAATALAGGVLQAAWFTLPSSDAPPFTQLLAAAAAIVACTLLALPICLLARRAGPEALTQLEEVARA
jgi:hypothetical protein